MSSFTQQTKPIHLLSKPQQKKQQWKAPCDISFIRRLRKILLSYWIYSLRSSYSKAQSNTWSDTETVLSHPDPSRVRSYPDLSYKNCLHDIQQSIRTELRVTKVLKRKRKEPFMWSESVICFPLNLRLTYKWHQEMYALYLILKRRSVPVFWDPLPPLTAPSCPRA